MTEEKKHTLYCSFCKKSEHECVKLVAGPNVFICDNCICLCMSIITPVGLSEFLAPVMKNVRDFNAKCLEEMQNKALEENKDGH